jgi:hypothetical protein
MAAPLHTVKTQFGSKEALVDKLVPLLDKQAEETEADFKDRLMRVSNRKLLRLLARETDLRERFGSRETLVDKIVEIKKGDAEYRRKLLGLSTGRLISLHRGLARRAG